MVAPPLADSVERNRTTLAPPPLAARPPRPDGAAPLQLGRGVLRGRNARPADVPPLTESTSPVMYSARGEARNSAALAMSRGTPARPKGICRVSASTYSGLIGDVSLSTSTRPGAMVLTLM